MTRNLRAFPVKNMNDKKSGEAFKKEKTFALSFHRSENNINDEEKK